tara:strand:- start:622 stop:801 length:180 start_codon:yes stop_codon:yes gene_type:complete
LISTDIEDYEFYTQAMLELAPNISAGLRYELATGNSDGVTGRKADDDRSDRHRFSPMLR